MTRQNTLGGDQAPAAPRVPTATGADGGPTGRSGAAKKVAVYAALVVFAVVYVVGRVFLDSLAGYALARLPGSGRQAISPAVLAVLAVPGIVLLIPKFLVLIYLGIYNTYPALIVPLLVDAAWVFIMKQFFESIPPSVEEAALIDGASTFRVFWSIALPMARPAVITLTILSCPSRGRGTSWRTSSSPPTTRTSSRSPEASGQLTSGVSGQDSSSRLDGRRAADDHPDGDRFVVLQRYFTQGANAGADKG